MRKILSCVVFMLQLQQEERNAKLIWSKIIGMTFRLLQIHFSGCCWPGNEKHFWNLSDYSLNRTQTGQHHLELRLKHSSEIKQELMIYFPCLRTLQCHCLSPLLLSMVLDWRFSWVRWWVIDSLTKTRQHQRPVN